ncbi:MAG: hypothetical protein HY898_14380 [Deltaproteobacteria bacterium]|nr:hypothetical protein [Deltaproteobacteria bacterium]
MLKSTLCLLAAIAVASCSSDQGAGAGTGGNGGDPNTNPVDGPPAGNPKGTCPIPAAAQLEDVSNPTTVVGDGTPASCTSDAFVNAVAKSGVITFSCGPDPITIKLDKTAKVFNDKGPKVVIDGGGKVTLSGGGKVRILYQDTCDHAQVWTSSHCQNQDTPALTVQNLTFVDGNATGQHEEGGGGGAIFVRGGQFKVINSRFFHSVCDATGPDLGGAAIRVLSQYNNQPVYIVNSTFGGKEGLGGVCSNGGALSSIDVSWTVLNSVFKFNQAIGSGAGPAGDGGAIYTDGNTYTETLCGVEMTDNSATSGGGGIVFYSGDGTGSLIIQDSFLSNNKSGKFESQGYPGIYYWTSTGKNNTPVVTNSTIE